MWEQEGGKNVTVRNHRRKEEEKKVVRKDVLCV
jgi:hypothetical protein